MVEVLVTDEFVGWFETLDDADGRAVKRCVDLLEQRGVALGHPHASAINGSRYALRELRIQSGGRPLRVLYAFDPRRNAVLILGGDKTGDGRFYERMVPRAENIWAQYLAEQAAGLHDEED